MHPGRILVSLSAIALLAACSDYNLSSQTDPNLGDGPDCGVVPEEYQGAANTVVLCKGDVKTLDLAFTLDVQRGDVSMIFDTTGSMGSAAAALAAEFMQIVEELADEVPNASYGFATYDDYAYGTFGSSSWGDLPFELRQQQTTDVSLVQWSLNNDSAVGGGSDIPESTLEAIYQAATGAGYDQDCNGTYNPATDVPPFRASPGDLFSGAVESYQPDTPGGGTIGGMGYRPGALPIMIYVTDADIRDPHGVLGSYGAPPAACKNAGYHDVVALADTMGIRLVGVLVSGGSSFNNLARDQMHTLAHATNSYADLNGDGSLEPLVVEWSTSTSSALFREQIVNAVSGLIGAVSFGKVDLDPAGNATPFIDRVYPEYYADVSTAEGALLEFEVTFEGIEDSGPQPKVYEATFTLMGDNSVELDSVTVTVVVPGLED